MKKILKRFCEFSCLLSGVIGCTSNLHVDDKSVISDCLLSEEQELLKEQVLQKLMQIHSKIDKHERLFSNKDFILLLCDVNGVNSESETARKFADQLFETDFSSEIDGLYCMGGKGCILDVPGDVWIADCNRLALVLSFEALVSIRRGDCDVSANCIFQIYRLGYALASLLGRNGYLYGMGCVRRSMHLAAKCFSEIKDCISFHSLMERFNQDFQNMDSHRALFANSMRNYIAEIVAQPIFRDEVQKKECAEILKEDVKKLLDAVNRRHYDEARTKRGAGRKHRRVYSNLDSKLGHGTIDWFDADMLCSLFWTNQLKLNLIRTSIALYQYKEKKGFYPEDLNELIPEWLETVPCDPYAGGNIKYSRSRKILWSSGPGNHYVSESDIFDGDDIIKTSEKYVMRLSYRKGGRCLTK